MPDIYTQQKLAIQGQFVVGSLADYTGQRKALHGTVRIVAHERKGGVVIECDGVRALVSPFALTPVAAVRPPGAGKRPEAPQNGHRPARRALRPRAGGHALDVSRPAKLIRNGVEVVPDRAAGNDALLDRLRQIGRPTEPPPPVGATPPQATSPKLTTPLGKANVERFFFGWLRTFRRNTPHDVRQAVIDRFDLPAYLRDRVPELPGLHEYRRCIYFIGAVALADPTRLPPPAAIPPLLAARFRVAEAAVSIHLKWMRARLESDHAAFAQRATVGAAQ